MVSAIDVAKRALVTLLRALAGIYGVAFSLTRSSADAEVRAVCRKLAKKTHPDHGGTVEHQTALNTACDAWEDAMQQRKAKPSHGGKGEVFWVQGCV